MLMTASENQKSTDKAIILGVRVDAITFQQTIARIEDLIVAGKPSQIVTVNPEFIIAAQRDVRFRRILNRAEIATPDGIGLIWAAKLLRQPHIPERVAGVDLVVELAKRSQEKGLRLFFLGAGPGVAQKAANILKKLYPNCHIKAESGGEINLEKPDLNLINLIRRNRPDILCVAFGFPKQDKWIYQNLDKLEVPVAIGVGGAFDYIAGHVKRAPSGWQKLGLEWLYRLFRQPTRFGRIFNAVVVFPILILGNRFRSAKNSATMNPSE